MQNAVLISNQAHWRSFWAWFLFREKTSLVLRLDTLKAYLGPFRTTKSGSRSEVRRWSRGSEDLPFEPEEKSVGC